MMENKSTDEMQNNNNNNHNGCDTQSEEPTVLHCMQPIVYVGSGETNNENPMMNPSSQEYNMGTNQESQSTEKDHFSSVCSQNSDTCDSNDETPKDPFAPECKIPLPVSFAPFDYAWIEPSFIRKRNERERQRVRNVNDGFERLRSHLPLVHKGKERRLSKVETLRYAISYIRHLQAMLD